MMVVLRVIEQGKKGSSEALAHSTHTHTHVHTTHNTQYTHTKAADGRNTRHACGIGKGKWFGSTLAAWCSMNGGLALSELGIELCVFSADGWAYDQLYFAAHSPPHLALHLHMQDPPLQQTWMSCQRCVLPREGVRAGVVVVVVLLMMMMMMLMMMSVMRFLASVAWCWRFCLLVVTATSVVTVAVASTPRPLSVAARRSRLTPTPACWCLCAYDFTRWHIRSRGSLS